MINAMCVSLFSPLIFFFQAEDGIRDDLVTGVQTCALPIWKRADLAVVSLRGAHTTPFYPESVISHLVYSCRGGDVQATVVDGQVLMADRIVRTVEEADVVSRAQETARELFEA